MKRSKPATKLLASAQTITQWCLFHALALVLSALAPHARAGAEESARERSAERAEASGALWLP